MLAILRGARHLLGIGYHGSYCYITCLGDIGSAPFSRSLTLELVHLIQPVVKCGIYSTLHSTVHQLMQGYM